MFLYNLRSISISSSRSSTLRFLHLRSHSCPLTTKPSSLRASAMSFQMNFFFLMPLQKSGQLSPTLVTRLSTSLWHQCVRRSGSSVTREQTHECWACTEWCHFFKQLVTCLHWPSWRAASCWMWWWFRQVYVNVQTTCVSLNLTETTNWPEQQPRRLKPWQRPNKGRL